MTDLNLTEAIKAVLPHVSRDYTIPILTNIHATHNTVKATDRYTAARVTVPTGVTEGDELLIPYELARLGITKIEPDKGGYLITTVLPPAIKRHNPNMVAPTWRLPSEEKPGAPDFQSRYPSFEKLMDDWKPLNLKAVTPKDGKEEGPYASFGLTSDFLARWASRHFSRGMVAIIVELGTTSLKPLRVTVEGVDNYTSLLVPVRRFA